MKFFLSLLFLGTMTLQGAEIVLHQPTLQFVGKRTVSRPSSLGGGVVNVEKVQELGLRFIFALQNTGPNTVKVATAGFNNIRFEAEPGKNQFVLLLSHRNVLVKAAASQKPFPVIRPLEDFRIVTLRPGEGTLLNVTCWIPDGKIRPGDELIIEYAPANLGRYDFHQLQVRSRPVVFKVPAPVKKAESVVI